MMELARTYRRSNSSLGKSTCRNLPLHFASHSCTGAADTLRSSLTARRELGHLTLPPAHTRCSSYGAKILLRRSSIADRSRWNFSRSTLTSSTDEPSAGRTTCFRLSGTATLRLVGLY